MEQRNFIGRVGLIGFLFFQSAPKVFAETCAATTARLTQELFERTQKLSTRANSAELAQLIKDKLNGGNFTQSVTNDKINEFIALVPGLVEQVYKQRVSAGTADAQYVSAHRKYESNALIGDSEAFGGAQLNGEGPYPPLSSRSVSETIDLFRIRRLRVLVETDAVDGGLYNASYAVRVQEEVQQNDRKTDASDALFSRIQVNDEVVLGSGVNVVLKHFLTLLTVGNPPVGAVYERSDPVDLTALDRAPVRDRTAKSFQWHLAIRGLSGCAAPDAAGLFSPVINP